jgi:hypothetical protein
MSRYDVAVAYRVYPGVSKTPLTHADDKLALARTCLVSFKQSLGDLRAKMFVLLDSCPPAYKALFQGIFAAQDLVFIDLDHVGNQGSFLRQIEILLEQNDSELVYLAEDDYLYQPSAFGEMLDVLKHGAGGAPADFVTPYDHADCYTLLLHRHSRRHMKTATREWQTMNSTCLTFLTTKTTLERTRGVFETYRDKKNLDASIWISLTQFQLYDPLTYLRLFFHERASFKILLKAWIYNVQAIFGPRYNLWAPVPAIATHTDNRYVSPGIDWLARAAEIDQSLAGAEQGTPP